MSRKQSFLYRKKHIITVSRYGQEEWLYLTLISDENCYKFRDLKVNLDGLKTNLTTDCRLKINLYTAENTERTILIIFNRIFALHWKLNSKTSFYSFVNENGDKFMQAVSTFYLRVF